MRSTLVNMHALYRLLLERFGGKVGRGLAVDGRKAKAPYLRTRAKPRLSSWFGVNSVTFCDMNS